MKGKIFNNEKLAQEWNNQYAISQGCNGVTAYWFPTKELTETTEMPKAEYAEWKGIPETITTGYDEETFEPITEANPEYTALSANVTVPKIGVVVGDELDETDEDTGEVTVPEDVVDISDLIVVQDE